MSHRCHVGITWVSHGIDFHSGFKVSPPNSSFMCQQMSMLYRPDGRINQPTEIALPLLWRYQVRMDHGQTWGLPKSDRESQRKRERERERESEREKERERESQRERERERERERVRERERERERESESHFNRADRSLPSPLKIGDPSFKLPILRVQIADRSVQP